MIMTSMSIAANQPRRCGKWATCINTAKTNMTSKSSVARQAWASQQMSTTSTNVAATTGTGTSSLANEPNKHKLWSNDECHSKRAQAQTLQQTSTCSVTNNEHVFCSNDYNKNMNVAANEYDNHKHCSKQAQIPQQMSMTSTSSAAMITTNMSQ